MSRSSIQPARNFRSFTRLAVAFPLCTLAAVSSPPFFPSALHAQAPAAVTPRQLGTVKSMDGGTLVVSTAAGLQVTVTVTPITPVLQLPPGSTDLKAATPTTAANIAVGDRVLVTGTVGDTASALTAARVILMKSTDIAARQSAQQADWQRNGTGGLVRAVDGLLLTVSAGTRTIKVQTTPATIFRRYADDSVKFEDAKPGKLDEIRAGDQISVRGTKSDDGLTIAAEEVVTGTFENLSGVVSSADASAGTVTLKDLISKKVVTVHITTNSDLRNLTPQAAQMFTARNAAGSGGTGAHPAPSAAPGAPAAIAGASSPGASAAAGGPGRSRSAGMDLSRMLSRLPAITLADLKPGASVMIVASQDHAGSDVLTAITLLSGVEAILSATPSGSQPITLSPWNLSVPEGGGGPQ